MEHGGKLLYIGNTVYNLFSSFVSYTYPIVPYHQKRHTYIDVAFWTVSHLLTRPPPTCPALLLLLELDDAWLEREASRELDDEVVDEERKVMPDA
jgi:hypothetical protein